MTEDHLSSHTTPLVERYDAEQLAEALHLHAFDDSGEQNVPTHLCNIAAEFVISQASTITDLEARLAERHEVLCFLGKWIERGLFCKTVTAAEALSVMAHFPGMPWNSERWDVDHKPYAAAYYAKFPKTAAKDEPHAAE